MYKGYFWWDKLSEAFWQELRWAQRLLDCEPAAFLSRVQYTGHWIYYPLWCCLTSSLEARSWKSWIARAFSQSLISLMYFTYFFRFQVNFSDEYKHSLIASDSTVFDFAAAFSTYSSELRGANLEAAQLAFQTSIGQYAGHSTALDPNTVVVDPRAKTCCICFLKWFLPLDSVALLVTRFGFCRVGGPPEVRIDNHSLRMSNTV